MAKSIPPFDLPKEAIDKPHNFLMNLGQDIADLVNKEYKLDQYYPNARLKITMTLDQWDGESDYAESIIFKNGFRIRTLQ